MQSFTIINSPFITNKYLFEEHIDEPVVIRIEQFDVATTSQLGIAISKATRLQQPILPVIIDSYGGDVYTALTMVDMIKNASIPVATIVEGKAMSSGTILFSAGSEGHRYISHHGTLKIHDVREFFEKDMCMTTSEYKINNEEIDRINKLVWKLTASNCKKPENYFLDLMKEKYRNLDWYLNATSALKHNLANIIGIPKLILSISTKFEFGL